MYARILVPHDGSPASERGLIEAVGLAAALRARLVILSVTTGVARAAEKAAARSFEESTSQALADCTALVDAAAARATEVGVPCVKVVVDSRARSVAQVILDEAASRECDLIVMGTHGRKGLSRVVLGSDAETVARGADVPVMLVRPPAKA